MMPYLNCNRKQSMTAGLK